MAGRPPKFSTVEELEEKFKEWQEALAFGGRLYGEVPDVEGFCDFVGCWRDLLQDYANNPKYSSTVKSIKNWIYYRKKQKAMVGEMPAAIFIFDAKNNAGYVDRQETDLTTKGKELPAPILGGLAKDVRTDNSDQEAS